MTWQPLISVVMPLKNGMPHLRAAIQSLAQQTYRNFELVIQDGGSSDGSIELLRESRDIPRIDFRSEQDNSIEQAWNRARMRARGEVITSLAADDFYEPDAFEWAVDFLGKAPSCAAVYGSIRLTDEIGNIQAELRSSNFDLLRVMTCEVVPAFSTAFFVRSRCGKSLYYDESVPPADYDLWLRLGTLQIIATPRVLARVRVSPQSGTCQPQRYEKFCRGKIAALERYLAQCGQCPLVEELRKRGRGGIYAWAAESMLWIPGGLPHFEYWFGRAAEVYPESPRLEHLQRAYQKLRHRA